MNGDVATALRVAIDAATSLGAVSLTVSDLGRARARSTSTCSAGLRRLERTTAR